MSDPFETLKHLDEEPVGPALPAAEVRRRGDRMRRRRTAVRALGAACAVAVITSGGIALGHDVTDSAPAPPATQGPSPSPSPTTSDDEPHAQQATRIPDGFPLLEGLPAEDVDSRREVEAKVSAPRIFDPCHNNAEAALDAGRTDYRRVTQSGPAYTYLHEMVVYESSSAANEAMMLAKGELERCPQYVYPDGTSRDVWEPAPSSERAVKADDFILSVNHGYSDHGVTTLATSWIVVRVGNAIVSLAQDGEFGASRQSVRAVVDEELDTYDAIASSMCPFADETTVIGCQYRSTAPGPGEVTDPGPAYLLDEARLRAGTGVEEFETVPDSQTATLPCQAEWLSALGADTADYRQFEARGDGGEGDLGAWAGTAVLGFRSELAAGTAYDTVGEWVSRCEPQVDTSHRLVKAVDSGIGEPHITRLPDGISFWRAVKLSAPERCVECDAAWDDYEGAVQVGRYLVLLHVGLGGDMQLGVDDSRLPLGRLLDTAAGLVRDSGTGSRGGVTAAELGTLGPRGIGDFLLGAPLSEDTWGIYGERTVDGCTTFKLADYDPLKSDEPDGWATKDAGVVALAGRPGYPTPQGITIGSSLAEVRAAYAHLVGKPPGVITAPASDTARYVFEVETGKVTALRLELSQQSCVF